MTGPRLVVFDMDGTLIDSQRVILRAIGAAFGAMGLAPPPPPVALSVVGLSLPEAMATLAPDLPPDAVAALVGQYRERFVADRAAGAAGGDAPLYPGARGALDRLAARGDTLMGVATGKARPGLDHALAMHDLASYFATTQTADAHPSKPHPSMLRAALAETGAAAARGIMVGDTEFDVVMGRAAGFATVGVAWGYHPTARLEAAGADLVIDAFDALDDALAELWARVP